MQYTAIGLSRGSVSAQRSIASGARNVAPGNMSLRRTRSASRQTSRTIGASLSYAARSASAVTGYQVQFKIATAGTYSNFSPTAAANATSQVITGLTASTSYNFQVFAFN